MLPHHRCPLRRVGEGAGADVEDAAVRAVMLEKLNEALHTLTDEEVAIIHALFYQEISEVELAKKLGIARTTLQSRKYKILEKLKKLL